MYIHCQYIGGQMIPDNPGQWIIFAASVVAALGILWKVAKRARRKAKDVSGDVVAIRDSILGRDAVVDSITGKELAPALPGIGQRMDTVERALVALADQHAVLEDHEERIKALEAARVERVVSQAESAAMWQAVVQATDEAE